MSSDLGGLSTALADRYRIERELGAGGMATVYLAHDVRHDRKVALKVLRPELSAILGATRFLAEIKTTANLQHPHILSLFDSGEADGTVFYVMPYVEGETLRDRIKREHQLPIEEAVRIAREVLDALEYAHKQGIVHRDIKPENILLHGGHAMVADFGIALAAAKSEGGTRMTETGMSLGTPHYMSPEQAMGEREITPKADIYALGAVLYEMLTGEPPFTGASAQAIFARVLTDEPRSLTLQRKTIPPNVGAAVNVALQKLPADRFASAAQFADALGKAEYTAATTRAKAAVPVRPLRERAQTLAPWLLTVLVGVVAVRGGLQTRAPAARPVIRYTLELASPIVGLLGSPIALSHDGSRMVFASQTLDGSQVRLYVRRLDQDSAVSLTNTENTDQPFFSPNGEWVAFWSNGALQKVAVAGGPLVQLTPANLTFAGGSWGLRGDIVFSVNGKLLRISADGGAVDTLLRHPTKSYRWPEVLPDGETVLFMTAGGGPYRIEALSLKNGKVTDLGVTGTNPRYVGGNQLLYATPEGLGGVFAVSFDPKRLRVSGPVVPVPADVRVTAGGSAKLGHSRNGIIAWLGGSAARRDLVLVDPAGRVQTTGTQPDLYESPRFSPDGRRIAVGIGDLLGGRPDIFSLELARGTLSRVTFDSASVYPEWSPDGLWIHYASARRGDYDLWRSRADGSGVSDSILIAPNDQWEGVPSPDGRGVVYRVIDPLTRRDILWLPTGASQPVAVLKTPFEERGLAVSPDGKWLAYVSNETGADEVYVRALPGPGGRVQISSKGGEEPRWGFRGRSLLYRARDSVYTVDVTIVASEVRVGRHRALFGDSYWRAGNHAGWDVAPDGSRFVFVRDSGVAAERQIKVLVNWFEQPRAAVVGGARRD